jgi:hypothetical protein
MIYNGNEYAICATPLEGYIQRLRKSQRPSFHVSSTAQHRGYQATWTIEDRRLLLTGLVGCVLNDDGEAETIDLAGAFPWRRGPIPATWVSDDLRCPEGRLRGYVHAAFASVYERDRIFRVVEGVLEDEFLVFNPPEPLCYRIRPDGGRERVEWGWLGPSIHPAQDPFPADAPVEPWKVWGDPDWDIQMGRDGKPIEGYMLGAATTFV